MLVAEYYTCRALWHVQRVVFCTIPQVFEFCSLLFKYDGRVEICTERVSPVLTT